ncbi:DNA-binding transcriptional MerR regulator [Neobacillus cucumis]|nr:DNA-binding transcriptional MerR regulator [Neobacillus cucumis]
MYTIGEVSQLVGVSTNTLRYYKKENIILPDRSENGQRKYTESHLQWLKFCFKIKRDANADQKIKVYALLF